MVLRPASFQHPGHLHPLPGRQLQSIDREGAPPRSRPEPRARAGGHARANSLWPAVSVWSAWAARDPATSASTACAINCRAPWRNKSVSGSGEKPVGAQNATTVSFVMWHILFFARTVARQQPLHMSPNLPVTNFRWGGKKWLTGHLQCCFLDVTVENFRLRSPSTRSDMTRGLVLRLNGRTSATIQAEGARIYRVSLGGHATDPQLRKVHLILQA